MFSFLFIAIIVLVSGMVAFTGDRLGSLIGRKRRSLWGLRPKHTANVVTVVTGMLITMLTLTSILLISEQARVALFGVESLKKELVQLNRQVRDRNDQLKDLRQRLQGVDAVYAAKEKAMHRQIEETGRDLNSKIAEQARLKGSIADLRMDYSTARAGLARAEAEVGELSRNKTTLQREIDQLRTKVTDLRDFARQMYIVKERGHVVFRADQMLAVGVVPAHYNPTKRRAAVMSLLNSADQVSVRLGSRDAAEVAAKGGRLASGEGAYWSRDQSEAALQALAAAGKDMVVTLSSYTNTVPGQPVFLVFNLMENKLVFRQNEVLIRDRVDGRKSHEAIGEELIKMLRQVREKAIVKGVLPEPGEGTVGSVSAFRILETIRAVNDRNREVELVIRTAADTWTSGPLIIDFVIEEIR